MYNDFVQMMNTYAARIFVFVLGLIWTAFVTILPYILIACALLAIHIFIAIMMERAARMKGHKKSHTFAMCFWLGIFGYIYAACLPDLRLQQLQDISEAIITNKEDVA